MFETIALLAVFAAAAWLADVMLPPELRLTAWLRRGRK